MRKLILGLSLLAFSRYIARGRPAGWRRFLSLQALMAAAAASAASELLRRHGQTSRHAAPPEGV